jgi:hypothetical protein
MTLINIVKFNKIWRNHKDEIAQINWYYNVNVEGFYEKEFEDGYIGDLRYTTGGNQLYVVKFKHNPYSCDKIWFKDRQDMKNYITDYML